ncbi:MAG: glucoamylase family protein [Gemmatimonadaceae bacterium]
MTPPTRSASQQSESDVLEGIQRSAFEYFLRESNESNGLVRDKTHPDAPASIAAVGLALTNYPVGVERGFVSRAEAAKRVLTTLNFFWASKQGREPDATGHKGLYYHFLDMATGARAWKSELSTVDSALLFAGMLTSASYFGGEIRDLAEALYARADWRWAQNRGDTVTHGWKPKRGFLPYRWEGYDEALLLYVLGLGSPTHALPRESYGAWASTYQWKTVYDIELLFAGPLFTHQLSHVWIDFRLIQDEFMREHGIDYFENSRRATYVQQQYGIRNPNGYAHYGELCWGLSASEGPGRRTCAIDGIKRRFFDYAARGVPYGPDDGTIAPWSVVASLPFAPEITLPTIMDFTRWQRVGNHKYGFKAAFNPTFPDPDGLANGWVSPWHVGINEGPIVAMIENYKSGLVWQLMRECRFVADGLRSAGFSGGWLQGE